MLYDTPNLMRNHPRPRRLRRGLTSLIAMLYLVLISSLAVGFYALTTTSSEIASNDQSATRAFMAAESGMDFMRRQMAHVTVPPTVPPEQAINYYYPSLQALLNGTGNLNGQVISRSGNTILIPANGAINLDSSGDARFRATITDWAGEIVVKVDGMWGSNVTRTITMDFSRQIRNTTTFNYAIASKGQIVASKGWITSVAGVDPKIAAIMSAKGVNGAVMVNGANVGGDVSVVDGATLQFTGGSVGGSSVSAVVQADHVHTVTPPEFPTVDTSVYRAYATNTYDSHKSVQSNIYVPPNTNPTFNGNNTLQGVVFIASPNQVTFNGSLNLQGFVVMAAGTNNTDALTFSGNLTMSALPNDPQFDSLRSVSGVAVLAPTAAMSMTGSSSSLRGNILVNTFQQNGAGDITIDQGTLMTFSPSSNSAVFNSSKSIKFTSTGANNQPNTGVTYSQYYTAKPATYQEPLP